MTKIKLIDETIIIASEVVLENGIFKITTSEKTVEELAAIFSDKSNTSKITLMTESEIETGYKIGFTSFAGIKYDAKGNKTIELFQPADVTEARLANAEGQVAMLSEQNTVLAEQNTMLTETVDSILTDIIPSLNLV